MAGHIADSGSVSWNTPEYILKAVREAFGGQIDLDPCSNSTSGVGSICSFSLPEADGLNASWHKYTDSRGNVVYPKNAYSNPPFGTSFVHKVTRNCLSQKEHKALPKEEQSLYTKQTVARWLKKCLEEHDTSNIDIIALVPASVDTKVWHDTVFPTGTSICWVKGRIKFLVNGVASKSAAPMSIAIILWTTSEDTKRKFRTAMEQIGFVVDLE